MKTQIGFGKFTIYIFEKKEISNIKGKENLLNTLYALALGLAIRAASTMTARSAREDFA